MTVLATVVDWEALGKVVLASLVAGVGVPAVYGFAVLGAARSSEAQRAGRGGVATAYGALAVAGTLVCLTSMAYGIWLLTQKG